MAGAVALASTGVHSCESDEKRAWAGPRRPARASRVPHRRGGRHCHGDKLESRVTRGARSSHPVGGGGWIAAQLAAAPGTRL